MCFFAYSCNNYKEKAELESYVVTKKYIDSSLTIIIGDFVEENNCKNCLNGIFFDKVSPSETIITLTSDRYYSNFFSLHKPDRIFKFEKFSFYVSTGIGSYVQYGSLTNLDSSKFGKDCSWASWTITDSSGHRTIDKSGGEPFLPHIKLPPLPEGIQFLPQN